MGVTRPFLLFLISVSAVSAQSVRVYSEFERIDPFGNIVPADRAEEPREILSPAIVRNGWTSFQVAVSLPQDRSCKLFLGQNPDHAVRAEMYKTVFVRVGEQWIPDGLEPLSAPEDGPVGEAPAQVAGQTTVVYWMDLWADRAAPVRRTRLEVQLNCGDEWTIYPMELRIQAARVPAQAGALEPVGDAATASSDSARGPLRSYLCGGAVAGKGDDASGPATIRRMIRRNARQDAAIARSLENGEGRPAVAGVLLAAMGVQDRAAWCAAPSTASAELGAEWYLRVRDALYRAAGHAVTGAK